MHVLITIAGRDRVGVVRDAAEAMLHLGASVEDSSMTALRGWFTIMMLVRLPEGTTLGALRAALADFERRTGLAAHSQPVAEADAVRRPPEADCVVVVEGGDRLGIVHAVADAIAAAGATIVDLATQVIPDEGGDRYRMALEVFAGDRRSAVEARLREAAARVGVGIDVHPIEPGESL